MKKVLILLIAIPFLYACSSGNSNQDSSSVDTDSKSFVKSNAKVEAVSNDDNNDVADSIIPGGTVTDTTEEEAFDDNKDKAQTEYKNGHFIF